MVEFLFYFIFYLLFAIIPACKRKHAKNNKLEIIVQHFLGFTTATTATKCNKKSMFVATIDNSAVCSM
jgi:hypothetical protein